jgi:hypothetical protein
MRPRVFKMFVPPGSVDSPSASGKIGAKPDPVLLGGPNECARSRLPGFLDDLVFKYPTPTKSKECVQNFYALKDFLIVSQAMKEFLLRHISEADVEIRKIRLLHNDGKPAAEPYFAFKIVRTIECVDPTTSTANDTFGTNRSGGTKSFSEMMVCYELDHSLTAEFANRDGTRYVSYPAYTWQIKDVFLKEGEIPADVVLFRPANWPSCLIIDADFGRLLEQRCSGGTPGYYFWMLDLRGVDKSYSDTLRMLR